VATKKKVEEPQGEKQEEPKSLLFVGDKKSGKTSLILKYLNIASSDIKETVALDFRFATKKLDELTVRVSAYELGGG